MKTTKKQKKSNLKVSLLLLLLAAVLLISSTYAWFVANNTATISTINVKVEGVEGLQISVDASAWKNEVTNLDITGAAATYPTAANQLPGVLKPVSSGAGEAYINNSRLEMYNATIVTEDTAAEHMGESKLTTTLATDVHGTSGNYIAFDVFLNSQSTNAKKLYLSAQSKVLWDNVRAAADSKTEYQSDKGLQNATRVAFMFFNNAATTDASTAQGWTYTAGSVNSKFVLWEPNADAHTTGAIANATATRPYDVPAQVLADVEGENKKVPLPYSGVKSVIEAADNVYMADASSANFAAKLQSVTPNIFTTANNTERKEIVTINPGVTKMRIYIWVEGQDMDCYTNASATYVNFFLKFEVDTTVDNE